MHPISPALPTLFTVSGFNTTLSFSVPGKLAAPETDQALATSASPWLELSNEPTGYWSHSGTPISTHGPVHIPDPAKLGPKTTAGALGAAGLASIIAMPSIAKADPGVVANEEPIQHETFEAHTEVDPNPQDWHLDTPTFVIALLAGALGLLGIKKATQFLTRSSKEVDADTAFLNTIANDNGVKAFTDFLYGLEKIPAAIAKVANDPNAPLGAGWFYSSDNPLMKPFLWLTQNGTTPLSEDDKSRLLEFAAIPDFIRTPLVALRYSLMIGQLKSNLEKTKTVAQERQLYYSAKIYSEITRAGLTIADFSTSMVASAFMLDSQWKEAMMCLAASHVLRTVTGVSMAVAGFFNYKDANIEDKIKGEAAADKGEEYNSRNPEVVRRALEGMAISAAMVAVELYVLNDFANGFEEGSGVKEQVALLKSSAAATMPIVLSLALGAWQSAAAVKGARANSKGLAKAKSGKER
ncbi:hypothetical protein KJ708_07605, partial [bacterium]|nr:hypothetical protein [bacterium]